MYHKHCTDAKGKALGIDHRITQQQYTALFPLNGIWVVERHVVWHANKNTVPTDVPSFLTRRAEEF